MYRKKQDVFHRIAPFLHSKLGELISMNSRIQKKIIQEAMKSFMLYGIKSTSMDMIATSLHISKRTLYESFPGKDELLKSCILSAIEKIKEVITDMEEECDSSLETILGINDALLQQALSFCPAFYKDINYYQHIQEIVDEELRTFIYNRLQLVCNRSVKEGYMMSDYNFEFLFSFFENNLFSFYLGKKIPPDSQMKVFRHTIQVYLTGICTNKGRDFFKNILTQNKNKTII